MTKNTLNTKNPKQHSSRAPSLVKVLEEVPHHLLWLPESQGDKGFRKQSGTQERGR